MKLNPGKYFTLTVVAAALLQAMLMGGCANTTTPPTGGKKDTIPPVITGLSPLPGTTGVSTKGTKIYITFDEYVKVKDPKAIFLSPPLEKSPKYKMRGKTLVVYFENDLDSNTTYTLDLTGAITDNNEGNPFPGYTLAFSTGNTIDSMVVTGTVRDCRTLQPVKGATVMLYRDLADSAVLTSRPAAAVKTDDWGYFAFRNIPDAEYRLYAMQDAASNNIYDPDNDKIAFADKPLRPTMKATDDLPEILKYDMKDTVRCTARKSEHELALFREKGTNKQMIVNKERFAERAAYITFMAEDAAVDSVWVAGLPAGRLIMQFNPERDSLELWVNDVSRRRMDTLHVYVDYLKTDTTGSRSPYVEHLKLVSPLKGKSLRSARKDLKREDTTCVVKVEANPETVEQYGFSMEFKYPIVREDFSSMKLTATNPRQQESDMKFTVTRDSLNLRRYTVMPSEKLLAGYGYRLKVPHRVFRDINGWYNDSTEVKVSLPSDDKLSTLSFNFGGVDGTYIIDLLDEKLSKVLRSYNISSDCRKDFPYLRAGKYALRLTRDVNSNGRVDTGSLLEHLQPEKVRFFKLRGGDHLIQVREGSELGWDIDIKSLFAD